MTTPTSLPVYTQGLGTAFTGAPFVATGDPTSTNILGPNGPFKIGQIWINSSINNYWALTSFTSNAGSVVANWKELTPSSTEEVLSVTGTANQIDASPNTGDVIVSLTDGVSLGFYQATVPPVGGLLVPGFSSFGTSTPDDRAFFTIHNESTKPWGLNTSGVMAALTVQDNAFSVYDNCQLSPSVNSNVLAGFNSNTKFYVITATTCTECASFFASPRFEEAEGTIDSAYGFYGSPFVGPIPGTLTNAYSGYFTSPALGTNQTALYADNISSGVAASGVQTPGTFRSAPPSSITATTDFGTITFGIAKQNTLGYDVIISGTMDVTTAVAVSILMGVGPTSTPTTSPITVSLTIAASTPIPFSAYVPTGYYIDFSGIGGDLTVDSISSVVTPV